MALHEIQRAPAQEQKIGLICNPFPYFFPAKESDVVTWRKKHEDWWVKTYREHVPAEWLETPRTINNINSNLTYAQKEALLTESNHHLGLKLVEKMPLSPIQLGLFLSHPELSRRGILDLVKASNGVEFSLDKLIKKQKELGVSNGEINVSLGIARRIISNRVDIKDKNNKEQMRGDLPQSREDKKKEIIIPTEITKDVASAYGVLYGTGFISNKYIMICIPVAKSNDFFNRAVPELFNKAFNLPIKEPKFSKSPAQKGKGTLVYQYSSEALKTYFLQYLGFPKNRKEKKETGLPSCIKNAPNDVQDEFLKYFIASGAIFCKDGFLEISSGSRLLLEDVYQLIGRRVLKHSFYIGESNVKTSFSLRIGILPTSELFLQGYLRENPFLKEKTEAFFCQKMGAKTVRHLTKNYPELMSEFKSKTALREQ